MTVETACPLTIDTIVTSGRLTQISWEASEYSPEFVYIPFGKRLAFIIQEAIYQGTIRELVGDSGLNPSVICQIESDAIRFVARHFYKSGVFDFQAYRELWRTACCEHKRLMAKESSLGLSSWMYIGFFHRHAISYAIEIFGGDFGFLTSWYQFGISGVSNPRLEGPAFSRLLKKFADPNKHFLAREWDVHPGADYFLSLMQPDWLKIKQGKRMATCGFRLVNAQTAIIEDIQGERHHEELRNIGWRRLLVSATEIVARGMGIQMMLIRPAETHQYRMEAKIDGVDLHKRMAGTAYQMCYSDGRDALGQLVYYKPLGPYPFDSNIILPKHRQGDGFLPH